MGAFQPSADETHDLGTTTSRWKDVHADRLVISGASNDTSLLTCTIGGHLTIGATDGIQTLDIASHDEADYGLKLAGTLVTASAAELNILDGVTATTAELNYVDGVTSAIQTQLDAKSPSAGPTFTGTINAANLTLSGNLTVNGTTTTVNSTTVTVDDPIFTLGGDTAPGSDDNKDRGIEFRYYDSEARVGFMGWDNDGDKFVLLKNATNNSEVFSGTAADLAIGALTLGGTEITATADELNYSDGVTSNIQTQLDSKQATLTGGATTIVSSDLTASRALVSNGSGKVAVSDVTSTELGYLDGVTSAIQTQLDLKAALASPALTGTPTAPTAAANTNTTQIATTAYVQSELGSYEVVEDTSPQLGGDLDVNGQNILFGDNEKAKFGDGPDLEIYHNGTDSFIDDTGEGSIFIRSGTTYIKNADGTKTSIATNSGAGQSIYFNNTKTLETIDGGAKVTVNLEVTSAITLGGTTLTATGTELNYVDGVTSAIQTQLDAKAPLAGPTFTGIITTQGTAIKSTGTLHITSPNSLYFNIDSDNDSTLQNFYWRTNLRETDPYADTLMKLDESGNLSLEASGATLTAPNLSLSGEVQYNVTDVSGTGNNYSVSDGDHIIIHNTEHQIILPAPANSNAGRELIIINKCADLIGDDAFDLTVNINGNETKIFKNGAGFSSITVGPRDNIRLISSGEGWYVLE